ncbi:sce7726 family protein [Aeromonas hydrophila]|nr:sce7726 family protein [Aeromonas hydrophila]
MIVCMDKIHRKDQGVILANTEFTDFFRSKNLVETAWYGTTQTTRDITERFLVQNKVKLTDPLYKVCELAYQDLLKSDIPEYVYKNILISKTVFGVNKPSTTSWIYEFKIGSARADAILIRDSATVFEIKTDLDDFSRAANQVDSYYSAFEQVVFVIGENQVESALRVLPNQVGILVLSNRHKLSKLRDAISFQDKLSSEAIFYLLRRNERELLQEQYGISTDGMSSFDSYNFVRSFIAERDPREIHRKLVQALRDRAPATKMEGISNELPSSLRAAVYWYKIKRSDWRLLIERLNSPIHYALRN